MCHWKGPWLFWGSWEGESGAGFGAVHPFPYSQGQGTVKLGVVPRLGLDVGSQTSKEGCAEVSGGTDTLG